MPLLNGTKVRHRAAALGWDLATLAEKSHVPLRAVQNCSRAQRPQPMKLPRIYAIGRALAVAAGEDSTAVTADIVNDKAVATEILAAKDEPKKEPPKREPLGPTRRQDQESTKGPKRARDQDAA